jgi:hypothetical protein
MCAVTAAAASKKLLLPRSLPGNNNLAEGSAGAGALAVLLIAGVAGVEPASKRSAEAHV